MVDAVQRQWLRTDCIIVRWTILRLALHYNISDLDEGLGKHQRHSYQVPKSKYTNLFLDGEHYGVGGTNSWGAWPLEKYRVHYGSKTFSFTIKPMK